jgi:hypothetical protein
MKKMKTAILSLLLLSICFVSFHDYLVADEHIKEISYSETHIEHEKALQSVVHDSLHHLFTYSTTENFSFYGLKQESLFFQQDTLSYHKSPVLLRPPLS